MGHGEMRKKGKYGVVWGFLIFFIFSQLLYVLRFVYSYHFRSRQHFF